MQLKFLFAMLLLPVFAFAAIEEVRVPINSAGVQLGTVTITQTDFGILLTPELNGLSPGMHGFHVHEFGRCGNNAKDAGGHYDPDNSMQHHGPYHEHGMRGDLPNLLADLNGEVKSAVLAPRLTLAEIKGRSLVVHEKADDYTEAKSIAGERLACGVIPSD